MKKKYGKIINDVITDIIEREKKIIKGYTNTEARIYKENNLTKRAQLLELIIKECDLENEHIKILDVGASEGIIPRALHNMGHNVEILEHANLYGRDNVKQKYDQFNKVVLTPDF